MNNSPLKSAAEEILGRCNIVDIISPVVPLKKAGSNYKACCPFHKEKTPSFVVSESRQMFHCFGCGASGDAISFVMKYYNLTFPEAVERLAAKYGVEVKSRGEKASDLPLCYDINKKAAKFFLNALYEPESPGMKYMERRGIDRKTLVAFGIGYADMGWESLSAELSKEGANIEIANEIGLLSKSSKTGKPIDYFRGRVIFPIIDMRRRVIGFGGRIIGEGEPKYLNSKDSRVFHKGSNLFGLNLARPAIQKEGFAFLVEGYMDVVGLYRSGVRNAVASLGTALTPGQAKLLKRYTEKVIICYDSDEAGEKAASRAIEILRGAGLETRVMNVAGAKDPDEFANKFGKDAFLNLANEKSQTDVDYGINLLAKKHDMKSTSGAVNFYKDAAGLLRKLPPVEGDIYIKKVAARFGISEGALRREVTGKKNEEGVIFQKKEKEEGGKKDIPNGSLLLERTLLRLMLTDFEYAKVFLKFPEAAVTKEGAEIAKAAEKEQISEKDFNLKTFFENLSEEAGSYLKEIEKDIQLGDSEELYSDCVRTLSIRRLEKESEEIINILSLAGDEDETDELMKKFSDIQKKLNELKGQGGSFE